MPVPIARTVQSRLDQLVPVVTGPPMLAFLPALTLAAYWLGGETALIVTALGLPLLFALAGRIGAGASRPGVPRDSVTGLMLREGFDAVMEQVHAETESGALRSACLMMELDDFRHLTDIHGRQAGDLVMQRTGERLLATLRDGDTVARVGDGRFAVCLMPVRQLDLELCIQLAGRLQAAVEEAIALDGTTLHVGCSIGFCLRHRAPGPGAAGWQEAAETALAEALAHGPSTIRAYSTEMHRRARTRSDLRDEAAQALDLGHIQPWFQPQLSTDTGRITGFEALARWIHPVRGTILPDTFLPAIEEAGLAERLGEVMLYNALSALKAWDANGCAVPCVGVNFSAAELRNPQLLDRIRWELDRFDLSPDRLAIEVLETVVSKAPDDVVSRNIAGLGELGCRVDLDDFGTGHASIAMVRRFRVSRIKIDRSFIARADRDPEQQRMIAAVLSMAERLDLETLAEGVETVGEHALLAQLGCDHVQGFGIAHPMPFDRTLDWIAAHEAKLRDTPRIGGGTG